MNFSCAYSLWYLKCVQFFRHETCNIPPSPDTCPRSIESRHASTISELVSVCRSRRSSPRPRSVHRRKLDTLKRCAALTESLMDCGGRAPRLKGVICTVMLSVDLDR